MTIEQHIENFLEGHVDSDAELVSEFKFSNLFDPLVNSKLLSYNKMVKAKIFSNKSSDLSYMDLKKGAHVKCVINLNSVWKVKNKFCYKWTILEIKIV